MAEEVVPSLSEIVATDRAKVLLAPLYSAQTLIVVALVAPQGLPQTRAIHAHQKAVLPSMADHLAAIEAVQVVGTALEEPLAEPLEVTPLEDTDKIFL